MTDKHLAGGIEFGASIAAVGRKLAKSGQNVKLSNGRSGAPQASRFGCDGRADVNEELAFDF